MPRGGARPGAGRKPGAAWKEKKPPAAREIARAEVARVLGTVKSPLAILCEIAADEQRDPVLRVQAATAVCPFLYPRLSAAVVADLSPKTDERPTTAALLGKLSSAFGRLAPPEPVPAIDVESEPEPDPLPLIEHED